MIKLCVLELYIKIHSNTRKGPFRTHFKVKIPTKQTKRSLLLSDCPKWTVFEFRHGHFSILWGHVSTWPKTNMMSRKMTHFCAVCRSLSRSLSDGYSSITDSSATKEKNVPSIINLVSLLAFSPGKFLADYLLAVY